LTISADDIHGADRVEGQTEAPGQLAEAAAQCEAPDSHGRRASQGHRQAPSPGLVVDEPGERCAGDPGAPGVRIDANSAQQTQVQHHAALVGRHPEFVVPSAFDREQQTVLARKRDRECHVGSTRCLDDEGRMFVEAPAHEPARVVITGIARQEERAVKRTAQVLEGGARDAPDAALECRGFDGRRRRAARFGAREPGQQRR
jgi:hypothetical protein